MADQATHCTCQQCGKDVSVEYSGQEPDDHGGGDVSDHGAGSGALEGFSVLPGHPGAAQGHGNQSLEDSYVMLTPPDISGLEISPEIRRTVELASRDLMSAAGMDEHLLVLSRIVELASAETGIDQPLCTSCAARFAKELEREVQEAKDDIRAYEQALERLEAMPADSAVMDALHRDVEETEAQIREEEAALAVLHERKLELIKELDDTAAEEARAREESDAADRLLLEYEAGLQEHLGERDALLAKINRAEREHDRLTKARPFVDCFHIWYDGPFGTITGFRLGRTPEEPVPWEEINAGLGQCVALLDAMARAWRRPFSKYRLVPMGSTSKIVDGKTTYPLYGPPRVKILAWKFDHAMVCYLTCLNEFATFLAEQEPPTGGGNVRRLELPFPIEGDRVNNMTVKVSFNREATWTKALKYMLADLKTVVHYMLDITDGHPADALGWVPSEAAAREDPGAQRRQSAGAGPSGVRQG